MCGNTTDKLIDGVIFVNNKVCGVGPNQVFEISEKSIKIRLGKGVRRAFLALKRAK
jgi:hypothetical protein